MSFEQSIEQLHRAAGAGRITIEELSAQMKVYSDARRRMGRRLLCGLRGRHEVNEVLAEGWPAIRVCKDCGAQL